MPWHNQMSIKQKKKAGKVTQQLRALARGLGLTLDHLHEGSQLVTTPVAGYLMPSSGLVRRKACTWNTNIHVATTIRHKKNNKISKQSSIQ